jgi:sigma-E factor negative regulatory protein RseB
LIKRFVRICLTLLWGLAGSMALAQSPPANKADAQVSQWLMRLHAAANKMAYSGTFVVNAGDNMSSSRIWHVCDEQAQMERVEALTGESRITLRRNNEVLTLLPERQLAIAETRESLTLFPNWLHQADSSIAQFYRLLPQGQQRLAGLMADVVQLAPVDALRFGYRVWTEQKTGVVMKLQTLDSAQNLLEQAAFSELQLASSLSMGQLLAMMQATQGYRVVRPQMLQTSAEQEGWVFKQVAPGFKPMNCHKPAVTSSPSSRPKDTLQCVFSDGLASVSLFIETYDAAQHAKPLAHADFTMGATHMLNQRLGAWWLTAVGEVPRQTLAVFVSHLERKK